jgi:hypothetical protein
MSTPSPQPLDYDLVSPYAPKHARDPLAPPPHKEEAVSNPRPAAINSDNDAKILDEIEASLRAMIAAEHSAPKAAAPAEEDAPEESTAASLEEETPADEPQPPTIDALEAPALVEDRLSQERRYHETMRVQEVLQQVSQQLTQRASHNAPHAEPEPEPEPALEEYRLPPAFLARSIEPIQFDEPWPKARPKKNNSASTLFVRFGLACGGAAAVMLFALPDLRARFFDTVGTPLTALSTNAAAVFGEGRPAPARDEPVAPVAVRIEPVVIAKEPDRSAAPVPKLASANLSPVMPEQRIAAVEEKVPPQRETVMQPMAPQNVAPEQPNRSQAIWHGPAGRSESDSPTTGVATRPLAAEEIELLRKMGNEFIAAGDFAGARGVLERAAEAGDAASAFALAATYDPAALTRFKVKGLMPDNAKAAYWYERARDLGSQEAPGRLKALARSN